MGQLVSAASGDAYEDRQGITHIPFIVKLAVGDQLVKVEYRREEQARAVFNGATLGQTVTVRVWLRIAKSAKRPGESWLRYEGWVPRS